MIRHRLQRTATALLVFAFGTACADLTEPNAVVNSDQPGFTVPAEQGLPLTEQEGDQGEKEELGQ